MKSPAEPRFEMKIHEEREKGRISLIKGKVCPKPHWEVILLKQAMWQIPEDEEGISWRRFSYL